MCSQYTYKYKYLLRSFTYEISTQLWQAFILHILKALSYKSVYSDLRKLNHQYC